MTTTGSSPNEAVASHAHRFAHALLLAEGEYILQHRDDKPGIAAPGMWALFGGRVEDAEDPLVAVIREVDEELCLRIDDCAAFWAVERFSVFAGSLALYSFFVADVSPQWGQHRLMEGQAVRRFRHDELSDLPMLPLMREVVDRHSVSLKVNP